MTTPLGVLPTGFSRSNYATELQALKDGFRATIGAELTLDEKDPGGALLHTTAERLDLLWQVAEYIYHASDPQNAEGEALFATGELTGVRQLPAQKGEVQVTLGLDASKTFAAGELVAHTDGDATNRWVNREEVASTTAGSYPDIWFDSEDTGARFAAPAGSLTIIAQRKSGWNSITNPLDAVPGEDAESEDDYRIRREESTARQGGASAAAIRSEVAAVAGVIQCRVYENNTDATVSGIPPHAIRVVVWDGAVPQADDDAIAQAILDKSAGIATTGALDGTATDANGLPVVVTFDRATVIELYCDVEVTAAGGADTDAIKASIQAKVPATLGTNLIFVAAKAAPLSVAGVSDIPVFELDDVDPPVNTTTNLAATAVSVFNLDSSNINVTFTP